MIWIKKSYIISVVCTHHVLRRKVKDSIEIKLGVKNSIKFGRIRQINNLGQYMESIVPIIMYWESMFIDTDEQFQPKFGTCLFIGIV